MTLALSSFIVILTALGQILLKKGATTNKHIFINWYVFYGYSIFIVVVILSMFLMNVLSLKYFGLIMSFTYPVTIFFANIFLHEKISRKNLWACMLIVVGGIVFNL